MLLTPLFLEAGAALYDCQGFEFGIGLLLFHLARLGARGLNAYRLRAILDNDEKKTAGQLASMLKSHLDVSEGIREALEDALAARNRLIHRILIDNSERMLDATERQRVIAEIRDLRRRVQRADKMVRPFIEGLSAAIDGVDFEALRSEAKDLLLRDPDGSSS